jgi:hypothetical protein
LLSLSRTPITSAGLEHLRGLSELEELSLSSTRVTAAGLAHLAKLPRLSRLSLIGVDSDDEMVRVLAQFPALAELRIEGPQLTGRSVHALSQMRLKQLTIHNTSLPAVDVRHLQFALPDCAVHIYPFLPPWPASP